MLSVGFQCRQAVPVQTGPFAGLSPGTEILLKLDETPGGDVTCDFGRYFNCGSGFGYTPRTNAQSELQSFEVFDVIGDILINADLGAGLLSFFGTAGSFTPNGCKGDDLDGLPLPKGYCDYFGYQADFSLTKGAPPNTFVPIGVTPLPASAWIMLSGLLAFGISRRLASRG